MSSTLQMDSLPSEPLEKPKWHCRPSNYWCRKALNRTMAGMQWSSHTWFLHKNLNTSNIRLFIIYTGLLLSVTCFLFFCKGRNYVLGKFSDSCKVTQHSVSKLQAGSAQQAPSPWGLTFVTANIWMHMFLQGTVEDKAWARTDVFHHCWW